MRRQKERNGAMPVPGGSVGSGGGGSSGGSGGCQERGNSSNISNLCGAQLATQGGKCCMEELHTRLMYTPNKRAE